MVSDETFTPEFYNKLKTFKPMLKLRLAAGANGGRKSNAKGSSVEFSDFREYIPGDDIRRIDWNAYARFDRLFVKLFMEEKEGIFQIYLVASASMNFGTPSKAVHAKRLAAALSYCILDSSDRVILNVLKNDHVEAFPSTAGKQGFSRITDTLSSVRFEGANDLSLSITRKDLKTRGMSVIISDLYTHDLEDVLKYLTFKKQEIMVLHVLSPEEISPEIHDTLNLIDSESSSELKVTAANSLYRDYKRTYESHIRSLKAVCKKYGARYVMTPTDSDFTRICS